MVDNHQRQFDDKRGALSLPLALGEHGPPVELDEIADQGEADAKTALRSDRAVTRAKAVKHVRQQIGTNALAGVADDDLHMRVHVLHLDLDSPSLRREFHGVAEEVPHDLK